jgi:hypothetical protein
MALEQALHPVEERSLIVDYDTRQERGGSETVQHRSLLRAPGDDRGGWADRESVAVARIEDRIGARWVAHDEDATLARVDDDEREATAQPREGRAPFIEIPIEESSRRNRSFALDHLAVRRPAQNENAPADLGDREPT